MKITELKPCENCDGAIYPVFYRVTVEQIAVDSNAVTRMLGLSAMFNGSLGLAEVFAPIDDMTTTIQTNSTVLCNNCAIDISLAAVLFGKDGSK